MNSPVASLRTLIPITVLVSIGVFIVLISVFQYRVQANQAVMEAKTDIRNLMLQTQRRIEAGIVANNKVAVEQELFGIGVLDEVVLAVVLDESGRILFSTNGALRGETAVNVISGFDAEALRQAMESFLPILRQEDNLINAYYPVVMAEGKGRVRPDKLGALCIQWSLDKALSNARILVINSVVLFALAGVFVVLVLVALNRRMVLTPIARLQSVARDIGAGHYSQEEDYSSAREISELEASIHEMGQKIKTTLDALKSSEERWSFALDGSGDGVADWDLQNDTVFYSAKLRALLGHAAQDYLGSYEEWKTLIHVEDRDQARKELSRHLHGETSVYQTQYRIRCADGTFKWMLVRGKVVEKDSSGLPLRFIATFMDVTDRRQMEDALRESEKKYRNLFELAQEGIWVIDECANTTMVNRSMARMLGYSTEEMMGRHITEFMDTDGTLQAEDYIRRRQSGIREEQEAQLIKKNGERIHVSMQSGPLVDEDGRYRGAISGVIDITSRLKAEETIRFQARYDSLTNLPNRSLLFEQLEEELGRAVRYHHAGAVLFVDLDHFKNINDSLGHPVGDQLLVSIANRIVDAVNREHMVARLGGDEFVVLLSQLERDESAAAEAARKVAEKIQSALSSVFYVDGNQLLVSCSIGIALFPKDDHTIHDIFKQADAAMYRSKQDGRNTIRFFSADMQEAAEKRMQLQMLLPRALEKQQFKLLYQPQFDHQRNLIGAEALIRWIEPDLGFISPAQFINVAEESGLIVPIGDWVIQEACRQFRQWEGQGLPQHFKHIAVNISPRQFALDGFCSRVLQLVTEEGVDPVHIELEITEGMMVTDVERVIDKMQSLRHMGFNLSVDDFGTGYSSLSYLKSLPLSKLKIDQSFTRDIGEDKNDRAIVETIIAMAAHLELDVLAEGVETEDQFRFLESKGCLKYQGWYFGKPVDPEAFYQQWVDRQNSKDQGQQVVT